MRIPRQINHLEGPRLSRMAIAVPIAVAFLALGITGPVPRVEAQQPPEPFTINLQNNVYPFNPEPKPDQPSFFMDQSIIPPEAHTGTVTIMGTTPYTTLVYAERAMTPDGKTYDGYLEVVSAGASTHIEIPGGDDFTITATKTSSDIERGFGDMSQVLVCDKLLQAASFDKIITKIVYDRASTTVPIDCGQGDPFPIMGGVYTTTFGPEIIEGRVINPAHQAIHIDRNTTVYGVDNSCTLDISAEVMNGRNTDRGIFRVWQGEWFIATMSNAVITPIDCVSNSSSVLYMPSVITTSGQ